MAEQKIAILIGSGSYEDTGFTTLQCPANDVAGMKEVLESPECAAFSRVDAFIDSSYRAITVGINKALREASKDDLILIYYSGHGKLDLQGRLYLATKDTLGGALEVTAISLRMIKELIDVSRSQRICVILDCCYSGAAGDAFLKGTLNDQLQTFSGGRGLHLLTASTRYQVAVELPNDKYSLLTKHIIMGLRDRYAADAQGRVTMSTLARYVGKKCREEGLQEPEEFSFHANGDVILAVPAPYALPSDDLKALQQQITTGLYDDALRHAKRLSIDFLKGGKRGPASVALSTAAYVLCILNAPGKAVMFAKEAHDLAKSEKHAIGVGYALAISALANLRLGEYLLSERQIDSGIRALKPFPNQFYSSFAQLILSEVLVAKDDPRGALQSADEALESAAFLRYGWMVARARLIKAICAEREGDLQGALRTLTAAEAEISLGCDVETQWAIKAALASAYIKCGRDGEAHESHLECKRIIHSIVSGLSGDSRERYLKNPAIIAIEGGDPSASGIWRVPIQIRSADNDVPESHAERLKLVLGIVKRVNSEDSLKKVISTILDAAIQYCRAHRGSIVVFEGDRYKLQLSKHRDGRELARAEAGIVKSVVKRVKETGKRVVVQNAAELALDDGGESLYGAGKSLLCIPLRVKTRLLGAIYVDNTERYAAFSEMDIEVAEIITEHAAVAIDNALSAMKRKVDSITEAYTHGEFERQCETLCVGAERHGKTFSLMLVDVDDYGERVRGLGESGAGEVLKTIYQRIKAGVEGCVSQDSASQVVIARYLADGFEIALPNTARESAYSIAERILDEIRSAKFQVDGKSVRFTASIGVAAYPTEGLTVFDVISSASSALAMAKSAGKNRVCIGVHGKW